jgi:hypothetical protein
MNQDARRMPGIRFERRVPALNNALPRMDVAAFVGFASSGPLDIPVAIEDVAQFTDLYGEDLELAWDARNGMPIRSHLGAAVRSFFANGGTLCWVVRVAKNAQSNHFAVPGLACLKGGVLTPAFVQARSEGSWSDDLRVGASLVAQPTGVQAVSFKNGTLQTAIFASPGDIVVGDLLQIVHTDALGSVVWTALAAVAFKQGLVATLAHTIWLDCLPAFATLTSILAGPPAAFPDGIVNDHLGVTRLRIDLFVKNKTGQQHRLNDMGLAAGHPRYLGALPTDRLLYETLLDDPAKAENLWSSVSNPRFPLAADVLEVEAYLPLGMDVIPKAFTLTNADTAMWLERDGLATFDETLFVDEALGEQTLFGLLEEADFIQYRRTPTRRLRGMHALLSLDQVTIVAIPEAVQPGWVTETLPVVLPPTPPVVEVPEPTGEFANCHAVVVEPPVLRPSLSVNNLPGASAPRRLANTVFDPHSLLAIQQALLRMAAARGDILALLSLPETYQEDAAVEHVTALRGRLETQSCNYGAVYHPWLVSVQDNGTPRRDPPDGAIAGSMALRARARGAWIAPANEALSGVVELVPPLRASHLNFLLQAQINVVQQHPAGFLTLSADTLAEDPDVVPINVRRLLILLRRVALQRGAQYVFEPNGDAFRRLVERGFRNLLAELHALGAFAGRSAETAYQVVVDTSVNTEQSVDQGKFIVELKVAPARPLHFLTVRLVQSGERGAVTEVHS